MSTKKFKVIWERHMIITPVVRLSFPCLFTPKPYKDDPDGKKSYRCDLIFTEDQLKEKYEGKKAKTPSLKGAIFNAKKDFWGPDPKKWRCNQETIKAGEDKTNSSGEVFDSYAGLHFITAKTGEKFPPKIIGLDGKPLTEQEVYGGCWVRAQLVARAYHHGSNRGVTLYLNQIMKVKDGEKFGGVPDLFDFQAEAETFDWDEAEDEDVDF